jgi:ABC-type cobalamin/Fe3+-siderophores transport system ATPase subunit
MTPYEKLNVSVEKLLEHTSRFVPMAFHLHSPASHDWGKRPHSDKARNSKSRFEGDAGVTAFLDELAPHFKIACVTDHMKVGYACELGKASLKRCDIRIFPGMEVNCVITPATNQRIHLLVAFPPEKDAASIERIFAGAKGMPSDADRTGNEELRIDSLREWVRKVQAEGGLVVIAHVDDQHRGHRTCFRALREDTVRMFLVDKDANIIDEQREISEEYRAHISDSEINAIEVMKPEDRHHFLAIANSDGRKIRLACVARCDCHCIEDFADAQKKTFVKVARLDFDSVRDALRFHQTRIKFANDLPDQPSPRLIGMRLRSPTSHGLFKDATIAFNPNLNCLIGPRGSGKSTIVEALRYVLGLNEDLADVDTGGEAKVSLRDIAEGIQQANLQDSIIELIYETREGARHVLHATYDARADIATEVSQLTGDEIRAAAQQLRLQYPVRVYSWGEIENLGRQPELQRALLDRLIERLPEYCQKRANLYDQLKENRQSIEVTCTRLARKMDEERGILRCYVQYKAEFERINTPEVAALFQNLDETRNRVELITAFERALSQIRGSIQELGDIDFTSLSEEILAAGSESLRTWWEENVASRVRLLEAGDTVSALVSQSLARLDEKLNTLRAVRGEQQASVARFEAELRERTQARPEEELVRGKREQSKARLDRAALKRTEYKSLSATLDELLTARRSIVAELDTVQDSISGARQSSLGALQSALTKFHTAEMRISVAFEAGKDREQVIAFLRDGSFFNVQVFGHYKKAQFAERCGAMASPTRIARAILTGTLSVLNEEGVQTGDVSALNAEEVDKLISHFQPFSQDPDADVRVVDADKLLKLLTLEEQGWDDDVRILLNDRPIDELSPGQRSSAMLPLVALSETVPLIIDQPEDNLDNRMVGTTLTRVLAELKERRQIIVTTHNPNIAVGGDAEQVVVLEATGARSAEVVASGSIDDPKIIRSVISIMEGGKEAFLAREARYEPELAQSVL